MNRDGQRHFCHPERLRDFTLADLGGDEILGREGRPSARFVVWESEYRDRITVRVLLPDGCTKDERKLTLADVRQLGLYRKLEYEVERLPEPTLDTEHGWLTQDGKLYPCEDFYRNGYSDHIRVGGLLEVALGVENIETVALKLQSREFMNNTWKEYPEEWRPTAEQRRTIQAYVEKHGSRLPYFMEDPEEPKIATRVAEPVFASRRETVRARMMRPLDGG